PNVVPVDFVAVERSNAQKEELELALKAYFAKAIASGEIVGAGVSVVKQGSIIISEGYGRRSTNSSNHINGETVFRLGSLSKGFAGVFVASLEHEKKLGWNNKVTAYLPNFKLGDSLNTNKIRLSHILSHTSGAPYHSFTNLVEADLPLQTIAERFNEVAPISEPGLQYSYQNALFALSGEIIESATGQDLATGLYNRFFKPLGMCSTSMDYKTLADTENVAFPHSRRKNGWRKLSLSDSYFNAIAAGGINASAHDMGKWMRFLLGHNPKILGQPAFFEAFEPFIEIPGRNKYYHRWPGHTKSYYGYGWRIHKFLEEDTKIEKTIWHHGGSVNNFRNEIAVYPEDDLGICVLLNSNSRLARTVIPDLYQIINNIYQQPSARLAQNNTRNESYPSKG
ncbi:MAG: serine hydrolase domain-containing protein, partial [Maribacter sp.]